MCEVARIASEARGYTVPPESFKAVRPFETEAERLADIAQDELHATTPQLWAWDMSAELVERNPRMDYATQCAAEAQMMRTFEAHADTLPLPQMPSGLPWPKGEPLPQKWREGLYMTKAELRVWAKEHAPDLLGSALLAEPMGQQATTAGNACIDGEVAADFIECAYNDGEPIDWRFGVRNMPEIEVFSKGNVGIVGSPDAG